jgi:hypothetical protein
VFGHNVGGEAFVPDDPSDAIPPRTFRGAEMEDDGDVDGSGDLVQIGREVFELLQNDFDDEDSDSEDDVEDRRTTGGVEYLKSQKVIAARWLTWRYRPLAVAPQGGKAYRIRRRAMTQDRPSRTAAAALQFPRGIGIDMDPTEGNSSAAILFSPTGAMGAEYHDDNLDDELHAVFILLGRVENANPIDNQPSPINDVDVDLTRYDCRGGITDDELERMREEVNLFSPDSRWVAISPAGRVVAAENYIFDPREIFTEPGDPSSGLFLDNLSGSELEQLEAQRERYRWEAQTYARQFENAGGR